MPLILYAVHQFLILFYFLSRLSVTLQELGDIDL